MVLIMAKKNYELRLCSSSIQALIGELEKYQKSIEDKLELFVETLANEYGLPIISANYGTGHIDDDTDTSFTDDLKFVDNNKDYVSAILRIKGNDLLYIEFGSGNRHNPTDNPLIAQNGLPYGVGKYPGQTHVPEPGYWYYAKKKSSEGIEATMPMYQAIVGMRDELKNVAQEIFGE